MKILKQDIAVLVFYFLGYSVIKNFILRCRRKRVARFVMFHDVPADSIQLFEKNLLFLKRTTNVVSFDDFCSGKLSSKKINSVITFDDGYKSWVTDVAPILKKLELPATFFISSGFVGLSQQDQLEFMHSKLLIDTEFNSNTAGLSPDEVRFLVEQGFTIGGHTVNHYDLTKLTNEEQLRNEIKHDKSLLEKITCKKIEYFAYPFGAYLHPTINLLDILGESGYKAAVTNVTGYNSIGENCYLLHREITYASMSESVFKARASGAYDAVNFVKKKMAKIKYY